MGRLTHPGVTTMPANLTPEYMEAERHFKSAKSSDEKKNRFRHRRAVGQLIRGQGRISSHVNGG